MAYFEEVLESYKISKHRETTNDNYLCVWRNFNKFIITLDRIPETWEERIALYCTFLVEICKLKSSTIKSYVAGIKSMLKAIDYTCDHDKLLLKALTLTCQSRNDVAADRLPIQKNLMEQILFEVERYYTDEDNQPYLELLYKTMIIFLYYGLLRISEITCTKAGHALKAKDVHFAENKSKILLVLHSSKTHGKNARPQTIKIAPTANTFRLWSNNNHFCPFQITQDYRNTRGIEYYSDDEQFFIFQDRSPVNPEAVRRVLKRAIAEIGLNQDLYDTHSFRSGRATDLKRLGCPVDTIKELGRWRSNAVYKYLRN